MPKKTQPKNKRKVASTTKNRSAQSVILDLFQNTLGTTMRKGLQLKIGVAGFFVLVSFIFLVFFVRKPEYVEVRMFLTQREWTKTWENYPDAFYTQSIELGLKETDEIGRVIAEVVDIKSYKVPYTHNPVLVTVKLRANYTQRTSSYSFQGKPLVVGDYQYIRVGNVRLQGYIVDLASQLEPVEQQKIYVKAQLDDEKETERGYLNSQVFGVPTETANFLKAGKSIVDYGGNPILEILSVVVQPSQRIFYDRSGSYTSVDRNFSTGEVILMLKTDRINGINYWNYTIPVQVGLRTELQFEQAIIPIRITEIVEDQNEIKKLEERN